IGRWRLGHRFNVLFLCAFLTGATLLTLAAINEDRHKPDYLAAARQAEIDAERARVLANRPSGIPAGGAVSLPRDAPLTQGPSLFSQKCAGCHRYGGQDGLGQNPNDPHSAADLTVFAT